MDGQSVSKQHNAIDLFKYIFAFAVVAIHTEPFCNCKIEWITQLNETIVKMAVPFFFIASGFFLGSKLIIAEKSNSRNRNIVKKYLTKILKMYLLWMAIYTPLAISHYISEGYSLIQSVGSYAVGLIFTGEQYNNWVLWYLLSTIYAAIVIFLLAKNRITTKKLIVISIIASILVVLFGFIGNYSGDLSSALLLVQKVIRRIFSSGRIFNGLVYIPIGIVLSKRRIPTILNWTIFLVGFTGRLFITDSLVSPYMLIVSSIGLFGIVEKVSLPADKVYPVMRHMSTSIYLSHLYIWTGYYMIVYGTKTYGADCFIVTSVVATAIAFIYWMFCMRKKAG